MTPYLVEQRVAEAVAREAGQRIRRAIRRGFDVSLKRKNDFVTTVDTEIETFVKQALRDAFPADSVLGEERGADGEPTPRRWFVDPIDGTANFVRGIPVFCVSIALRDGDDWVVGVIYDPNRDELFSGRVGGNPTVDGVDISTSETDDLGTAMLATGFPPRKSDDLEDNLENFTRIARQTRGVRRLGSAALDLAYVACGRLDAFWEYHLNPWDVSAGALLVRIAGGRVSTVEGGEHTGFESSIAATNGPLHASMLDILRSS